MHGRQAGSQANQLQEALEKARGHSRSVEERLHAASKFSRNLLHVAENLQTRQEKREQKFISFLIKQPALKALSAQALDCLFRTKDYKRIMSHLTYLCKQSPLASWQQNLFSCLAKFCPTLLCKSVQMVARRKMSRVIAPGEQAPLAKRLRAWHHQGLRVNLNRLGEAILGQKEARKRLDQYLLDLTNPLCDVISIKISSICSQINLLAWEDTLQRLKEPLRHLYRQSLLYKKSINLDMEEYKDLMLTKELFCSVLSEEEFYPLSAGIALQSYLPDSFAIQKEITAWAIKRCRQGAAPIKIRLVKGANLGMERVEASIKEWPQAPYTTKQQTDANFIRMMHFGMQPENCQSVHLGIASHNIFDISYAMLLACEKQVEETVCLEMLAGMAPHITRAVSGLWKEVLLYCPAATKDDLHTAMAYLARRLDENTAPDNFLTHLFDLQTDENHWKKQEEAFALSCLQSGPACDTSRREKPYTFINEPDSDWSQQKNRRWASEIAHTWKEAYHEIPLVIDGKIITTAAHTNGKDPSRPGHAIHRYCLADEAEIERSIACAKRQAPLWASCSPSEKSEILQKVALSIRQDRSSLIGAMVQEAAKPIAEADGEVSEAIDFLKYYAERVPTQGSSKVALVVTPWNFPCSIPCSAIASALACGYSVIFKPAPEAVLSGWLLASHFWQAGIPKTVLQFVTCTDSSGWQLIEDSRIDIVIFTGATSTARSFLKRRPTLRLFGETGGKNSLIVSNLSDHDQAIKDLVHSAFGYAGQKCSACSLAILEEEVYYSTQFRQQLLDAASTLVVGSSWNLDTVVGPLIRPAADPLLHALTHLNKGEEWLLQPKIHPENSQLWSPGIKYGVSRGSDMYRTELFGPMLSVMCAKDIREAIDIANSVPYGLTAGLHSLDKKEQLFWKNHIQAGNCYINRSITGAIVGRQPFGGCKASSFGIGMKVGGPHYLLQFETSSEEPEAASDSDRSVKEALESYAYWWEEYYRKEHALRLLVGQDNLLRFVPKNPLFVLIQPGDTAQDIALLQGACRIVGSPALFITEPSSLPEQSTLRCISTPPVDVLERIGNIGCLDITPPLRDGKRELIHWLREVSLSYDYHRYGSLMQREQEPRESPQ